MVGRAAEEDWLQFLVQRQRRLPPDPSASLICASLGRRRKSFGLERSLATAACRHLRQSVCETSRALPLGGRPKPMRSWSTVLGTVVDKVLAGMWRPGARPLRLAVLIDADGISPRDAQRVIDHVPMLGRICILRVYGNFAGQSSANWTALVRRHGAIARHLGARVVVNRTRPQRETALRSSPSSARLGLADFPYRELGLAVFLGRDTPNGRSPGNSATKR